MNLALEEKIRSPMVYDREDKINNIESCLSAPPAGKPAITNKRRGRLSRELKRGLLGLILC